METTTNTPEWLTTELDSLNTLKVKFSKKYKRTFKQIEASKSEEECTQITTDMYLELMLRVLKTAGVDRTTVLLERL